MNVGNNILSRNDKSLIGHSNSYSQNENVIVN